MVDMTDISEWLEDIKEQLAAVDAGNVRPVEPTFAAMRRQHPKLAEALDAHVARVRTWAEAHVAKHGRIPGSLRIVKNGFGPSVEFTPGYVGAKGDDWWALEDRAWDDMPRYTDDRQHVCAEPVVIFGAFDDGELEHINDLIREEHCYAMSCLSWDLSEAAAHLGAMGVACDLSRNPGGLVVGVGNPKLVRDLCKMFPAR